MKNSLISFAAAVAIGSLSQASAENRIYTYNDADGQPVYSALRSISPNGKWAAGGDDTDQTGSIIVNTADPENPVLTDGGMILGIDNNGMAFGAAYNKINYTKYENAGIYRNGQWEQLPLPEVILGRSYAVAISADSKTLIGHGMCVNDAPDEPGKYFPIIWKLNEDTGNYDLWKVYNNLWLPGTYGFFIRALSPDGKWACGAQFLDMGDNIAAMMNVETGEYTIWHEIDYREWYFEFMGKTYVQSSMFVDDYMDGFNPEHDFAGDLIYATDRYLFGSRGIVTSYTDEGDGTIENHATVYDLEEKCFIDGPTGYRYTCGIAPDKVITSRGDIISGDVTTPINSLIDGTIDFVYSFDESQRIVVGSQIAYTAFGEPYETPALIMLDQPVFALSGINDISVDAADAATVSVAGRTINVAGAAEACIYTTDGTMVGKGGATVAPGIYIVVADGVSHKVIVR